MAEGVTDVGDVGDVVVGVMMVVGRGLGMGVAWETSGVALG